jgi:predicted transcriptional regulator
MDDNYDMIKEGFATWEMTFEPMTIGGVKLDPKTKYRVKARSTMEAIKKASKEAGLKGDDWMVTQTKSLKKVG